MANANTAKQLNTNKNYKHLQATTYERGTREKFRKARLRRQHTVGKLCLLFTAACFAIGATVLPEAATAGLLFLVPGLMLTFSKKVW